MIILIKLILAHLLGDFLLQPDSWVRAKEKLRWASWQLYAHIAVHFLLMMILVFDLRFWIWALLISLLHYFIDLAKLYIQKRMKRSVFFVDQLVHVFFISLIWVFYNNSVFFSWKEINHYIVLFTFIYAITQPSSIMVSEFISRWSPKQGIDDSASLSKAGNWIGIFERIFIFFFVIYGKWEAIGFLLAAKSVFRFGDLKDGKEIRFTEYVLIGTLLSFGIAIFAAVIYLKVNELI